MYLKKCEITNFRSIKEMSIGFENNFQILVGLNEAGKSNILKALSFIESSILPEDDDIRDPRHDEPPVEDSRIRFVFGFDKKETRQFFDALKPKFLAKNINCPLIQIGSRSYTLHEFCDYKKEGLFDIDFLKKTKSARHWNLYGVHITISKDWKRVPKTWSELPKFDNKNIQFICIKDYPEYINHPELIEIKVEEINSLVGAEVIALLNKNLFECIVWRYSENNLLPGRIDIEKFKANPDICEPLRNIFYLAGYDDIAKTISDAQAKTNGMRNLLGKLSENTTRHLRKVWPEYKKTAIDLTQNGAVIEAGIEDEFNVYSLDRRSDGFKRFITFLLMISAKVKAEYLSDTLIIIDEPDIGLHPSGVQFLREELKKISKNNFVVIASHSIFMVDKDRIDRHLIVKKEKEETLVTTGYGSDMLDEEVIYRALGYSLFELLKKKNVIFEGWSDKYTFKCWLDSSSANKKIKTIWKDIGMIHAFGAKDVQRVASHLESFDREYLIISDADQPSLEWKNKFEGKFDWFTYRDLGFTDKETIEDFLVEDYVIQKIMEILKREQLDVGVVLESGTTFNNKIKKVNEHIKLNKDDFTRLKKVIKNAIFEELSAKDIELEPLMKTINL